MIYPFACRDPPRVLGTPLHARWIPPRSGDPSTLRGSLHAQGIPPCDLPSHFGGTTSCGGRSLLPCRDPPCVSGSTSRVGITPRGLQPLRVSPPPSVDPSTLRGSLLVISLRISVVNHLLHSLASSITILCLGLQRDVTSPLGVGLVAVFVR